MFILCTHCQFLVALDARGQPPAHCPNCDGRLPKPGVRASASPGQAPVADAAIEDAPHDAPIAQAPTIVALPEDVADAAIDQGPMTDAPPVALAADAAGADAASADATTAPDTSAATAASPDAPQALAAPEDRVVDAADRPGEPLSAPPRAPEPEPEVVADAPPQDTPGEAADVIAEAMLGPAAVEVEVDAQRLQAPPEMPQPASPQPESPPAGAPAMPEAAAAPLPAAHRRRAKTAPSFLHRAAADRRPAAWSRASLAAIAGLSVLLALQLLLADRARLSADAQWRPMLSMLCGVLRCQLPQWREPAAFALLDRDVRPHPSVPGALRVTATFRNDARWAQPWPALLLTLSDANGHAVGARVFNASDYLGAAPTQGGLKSGQSATIAMDVLEPSPRIVAFTFDFR